MVDQAFSGVPLWLGGPQGLWKEEAEAARRLRELPYESYPTRPGFPRIAPFSNLQNEAFNLAQTYSAPEPRFGEAGNAIERGLGRNIGNEIAPYLQRGTTAPGSEQIGRFLNPYQQQVSENINRYGTRNLTENILPNIQNRFISSGQYGSTGHQNLTNRAIRDTQEAISQSQANAMHGGFNTALQAALGQQGRQLEAGQLAGTTAGRDVERQLLGGEALQNLAGAEQTYGIKGTGLLSQLGGQQQQQEQNAANVAYQDFMAEKRHPYEQLQFQTAISRGQPAAAREVYGSNIQGVQPPQPQASPYSQMGGMLMGLTGAANQRQGYSHGGEVKKLSHHRHYAEGGSLSPIQQGANAAIDTAELKSMRDQAQNLSRQQVDPFWASIAHAGFNMAANRQPGVLANLGEAAGAGLNEYHSQLANQDKRGSESAKIMDMIDTTRRLQAENNRKHQLEREKFGQHQKEFGMTHGIQAGHLALAREKNEREKGSKGKTGDNLYKKSNEKELESIRKSSETLPKLKANISKLREIAGRLDSGPYASKLPSTTYNIPVVGKYIAMGTPEDINNFNSVTNELGLDIADQLKGSQIALGTRRIVALTKPQLENTREGNLQNLQHIEDGANLIEQKNEFMTDVLNSGLNAVDGHKAFNKYANAKLDAEEKGEEFLKTPEDYLNESTASNKANKKSEGLSEEEYPDELLMKIAGMK